MGKSNNNNKRQSHKHNNIEDEKKKRKRSVRNSYYEDDNGDDMEFGELIKASEGGDFEMPKWMECTWRRNNCGLDECNLCGRINKQRQKHIERGEDPDSIEAMLEDVGENFRETFSMLRKDTEKFGIDISELEDVEDNMPPKPEEFSLWKKIMDWRESINKIGEAARLREEFWLLTEEAADLFWYSNTITAKTYRQLCSRWELDKGDEYGEFDMKYTKYILSECFGILESALTDLADIPSGQQEELCRALKDLNGLKERILAI